MAGVVLALAGLTCGDGGPGTGAAAAPAVVNPLCGEWAGTWRSRSGKVYAAELRGGVARAFDPDGSVRFALRVVWEGDGLLRVTDGQSYDWPGIYRLEGGCLVICSAAGHSEPRPKSFSAPHTDLFTLLPSGPRKP
jgi:hypothetical protein